MANTETGAWQQGAELAFRMLREIGATSLDETAHDDDFRDHRPQRNVVGAYMAKLRDLRDSRCDLAFASILTDHLASSMHAGEPDLEKCAGRYRHAPIANVAEVPHG